MPWVRFDDQFDDDPDLAYLSPDAVCLNLCACTWSARKLTDGFIPIGQVRRLMGFNDEAVSLLIAQEWWISVEGGYQVRSYLKYNPSREEVISKREAERDRKAKWVEQRNSTLVAAEDNPHDAPRNSSLDASLDAPPVTSPDISPVMRPVTHYPSPVSHIPESGNPVPEKSARGRASPGLSRNDVQGFWMRFEKAYPKRSGSLNKAAAKEKFAKLATAEFEFELIISGAERFRKWADATGKTGSELVAQMTTWLNQKRWTEDYDLPIDPATVPADEVRFRKTPMVGIDYELVSDGESAIRMALDEEGIRTGDRFNEVAWQEARRMAGFAS